MTNKHIHIQLAELLLDVVPKTMQSIREEMRRGRGDLSVPQFRVLAAVNRGCHNKEIGERLGVSEAAISRMVDHLVADGLIKKGTSKLDRRQSVLSLTSEGIKKYNFIKSDARASLQKKLASLSPEEADSLFKGLEVLQRNPDLLKDQ